MNRSVVSHEAMSQIDEQTVYNIWGSDEFWNSSSQNENEKNDTWSHTGKMLVPTNISKINGIVSVREHLGNQDEKKMSDLNSSMASWTCIGSSLQDVDLPSIWSAPKLYPSNEQNLSLSDAVSWKSVSVSANDMDQASSIEPWDSSGDPLLFPVPNLDQAGVWKGQLHSNVESTVNEAVSAPDISVAASMASSSSNHGLQNLITNLSNSSSISGENGSQKIFTPIGEESSTPLSAEQLCDHLINSNDGWGSRPIDQSTPWDFDNMKSDDSFIRSGITTPTPASRSDGNAGVTSFNTLRPSLQTHSADSNVWTNEPPTGTAIWEMHYENSSARGSSWPAPLVNSTNTPLSTNPLMCLNGANPKKAGNSVGNAVINRVASNRTWEQSDKFWNNPVSVVGGAGGRPVLGNARASSICTNPADEMSNWCGGDLAGHGSNAALVESNKNLVNSWDGYPPVTGNSLQWTGNNNNADLFPPGEEQRRHQSVGTPAAHMSMDRMPMNAFNNTYRADSVKYLMSYGFKKEEALPALIDCNMDPERALQELRERYQGTRSFPSSGVAAFQANYGGLGPQFPNSSSLPQSSQHPPANGSVNPGLTNNGVCSSAFLASNHRGKPSGPNNPCGTNPAQAMPMSGQPNPQLIRQQLTQQVRTALNLPLPPHAVANSSVVGGVTGTSLLGQPPPPLLNGGGTSNVSNLPHSATGPNFLPTLNRNSGSMPPPPFSSSSSSNVNNLGKRSARQMTIITAIQDLQKKHQSIQQQIMVYRNNSAMCSQPQYADLFTELQGQMHQIEAQLKAKQAQLNIAYAQDCAAAAAVASSTLATSMNDAAGIHAIPANSGSILNTANNPLMGTVQQSRPNQEQLIHQLMELRLRPGGSAGSAVDGEGDFPTVGTWAPYKMNNQDGFEKMPDQSGPRSVIGQRGGVAKPRNQPNWGTNNNTWQPVNSRPALSHPTTNWSSMQQPDSAVTVPQLLNATKPLSSGVLDHQTSSGPWLLIQPHPNSGLSPNLNVLHNLLCHYGLTYFHALNPASGSVLVRLQSPDYAFQMMRALGDRLMIESVTDPEKILQLQRGVGAYNQVNLTGDADINAASNWSTCGDPNKKSNAGHNASRLGVMVTGTY